MWNRTDRYEVLNESCSSLEEACHLAAKMIQGFSVGGAWRRKLLFFRDAETRKAFAFSAELGY